MAAIAAIAFAGCDKDDDSKKNKGDDLVGTTWTVYDGDSSNWERQTLSFLKDNKVTLLIEVGEYGDEESFLYTGTYNYNNPNVSVTVSLDGTFEDVHSLTGIVSGKSLSVYEEGYLLGTFTRK